MGNGNIITRSIVSLLPAAGAFFLAACDRPVTVDWSVALPQEASTTVDAGGRVTESKIPLALVKSGIVGDVFVEEGASVRSGDTLAVLDNREEENMVAQRRVDVAIAGVNLDRAKNIDYRQAEERLSQAVILEALAAKQQARSDSLFLQGSITRSELDGNKKEHDIRQSQRVIAETDLAAIVSIELQLCESRLKQARLLLQESAIALSRTILRAPSDGKVVHILHARGEFTASGTPLLLFQPADRVLSIELPIERSKAQGIRPGQQANVTIPGNPPRSFETVVKGVAGGVVGGNGTAVVLLKAHSNELMLQPGQTVSARIITGTILDAFVIGRRFIKVLSEGDCVYLKKGNRVQRCMVRFTDIGKDLCIVRSGITAGDTVIAANGLSERSVIRLGKRTDGQTNSAH